MGTPYRGAVSPFFTPACLTFYPFRCILLGATRDRRTAFLLPLVRPKAHSITRRKPSMFRVATNIGYRVGFAHWWGMVYFLRMTGTDYYKIGYTSREDVLWRLAELQTACPRRLEVVATVEGDEATEADMHRQYWQYRTDGGAEWFEIPPDKAKEFDHGYAIENGYRSAVGGATPFDVRPLRRGQFNPTPGGRENVPSAGYGADNARPKYPIIIGGRKYQIGMPPVLREERQDDCLGHQQLHDDKPV